MQRVQMLPVHVQVFPVQRVQVLPAQRVQCPGVAHAAYPGEAHAACPGEAHATCPGVTHAAYLKIYYRNFDPSKAAQSYETVVILHTACLLL